MHRVEWKSNEARSVNCVVRWYFNFGVSSSIEKNVLEDDVGVQRYWGCRGSLVAVVLRPDVVCGWNYPEETHMHGGVSDCAESCADQQKQLSSTWFVELPMSIVRGKQRARKNASAKWSLMRPGTHEG